MSAELIELIHQAATVPMPLDVRNDADWRAYKTLVANRLTAIEAATMAPASATFLEARLAELPVTYPAKEAGR